MTANPAAGVPLCRQTIPRLPVPPVDGHRFEGRVELLRVRADLRFEPSFGTACVERIGPHVGVSPAQPCQAPRQLFDLLKVSLATRGVAVVETEQQRIARGSGEFETADQQADMDVKATTPPPAPRPGHADGDDQ